MNKSFENGMTVGDLRALLAEIPDLNDAGEPNEVWMHTGKTISSQVRYTCSVGPTGDIIFDSPTVWEKYEPDNGVEPIIHSHMSDILPEGHPLAEKNVECRKCKKYVHANNNECMSTWVEIAQIPFCIKCALPIFEDVLTYAPLYDYLPKETFGEPSP